MQPVDGFEGRLRARLQDLDARGLRRTLQPPNGIDLSSNDYLGLATHRDVVAGMIAAVEREGCGSTGSRLLRGAREAFSSVERTFAELKGTARSLYFSSGYLANIAVLTTFPESGDIVFSDDRNHASLIDGLRLSRARRVIFPHRDVATLTRLMRDEAEPGQKFLVTESVFSMDGDTAPLMEYAALCRAADAMLIVDEAHAVGVYGATGSGLIEHAGIDEGVFVSINPAGKALGVGGAFVAGSDMAVEYLVQGARSFMFSTAPPPAVAGALEASLRIVQSEPDRRHLLLSRVRYLRERLKEAAVPVPGGDSPIIPLVVGDPSRAMTAALRLQAHGFDVRAIRPPSVPVGRSRLRISVNVNLSESTLDRFVSALVATLTEVGACSVGSS